MAYARFGGDSDVYVYSSISGGYQFHLSNETALGEKDLSFNVPTLEEALHRMNRMKTQGYKIPQYAIDRMKEELDENREP